MTLAARYGMTLAALAALSPGLSMRRAGKSDLAEWQIDMLQNRNAFRCKTASARL